MLAYLPGTTIDVRDLFRIGRFKKEAENTSRPVLVKLSPLLGGPSMVRYIPVNMEFE